MKKCSAIMGVHAILMRGVLHQCDIPWARCCASGPHLTPASIPRPWPAVFGGVHARALAADTRWPLPTPPNMLATPATPAWQTSSLSAGQ